MVTSKNSIAVESAGLVSVILHKKPRAYTKYSLRFLLHLTKKSLAARLTLNIQRFPYFFKPQYKRYCLLVTSKNSIAVESAALISVIFHKKASAIHKVLPAFFVSSDEKISCGSTRSEYLEVPWIYLPFITLQNIYNYNTKKSVCHYVW